MRIAIVGSGISGLGAAWALHRDHEVTVFEAARRIGGHSNTVEVSGPHGSTPVDTGFIVYNEVTYPHLTRLFGHLDVPTEPSDMSFSFSIDGGVEYAARLRGLVGQPSNLLRRRYRRMIGDILRFRRVGPGLLDSAGEGSIGDLLASRGFSEGFLDDYLLPMTGAIWSARRDSVRRFPAAAMLRFLANHGLIRITGRPAWRTVSGGSREYLIRLTAPFCDRIRLATPVLGIDRRSDGVEVTTPDGTADFEHVVLATHSDQALRILGGGADTDERTALEAIPYQANRAVLHGDHRQMPRRRAAWSSWNVMAEAEDREQRRVAVTYWMNRLQNVDPATPLFVTLNPIRAIDPAAVVAEFEYDHPQFGPESVAAQRRIAALQGRRRTWYAGAYLGYGFHEDGLQAGLNVAAALGSPAPWWDEVTPVSSSSPPIVGAAG